MVGIREDRITVAATMEILNKMEGTLSQFEDRSDLANRRGE